ncbi:helix-turn-helix domain-containing protein [Pseudomonadota bacterium]
MDTSFSLLSTLTLLGAAQGVFLAMALLNTRVGDIKAHQILALLTFLFAMDLGEEFLYQIGFFESVPNLLHVLAPIDLLYGPLIFLYVSQLTSPSNHGTVKRHYLHFLPALAGILALLPFFLMDGSQKLEFTEALRTGDAMENDTSEAQIIQFGFILFMLGTIVQLGMYLLFSIRRLIRHSTNIRNEFSDIDKINLAWLRNLLLGLSCIYLLYLGDQFFPDLLGMNILGDMVTVVAVMLIYAMGYLGLRQPAIFTRALAPPQKEIQERVDQVDEKYRRSGLDKGTSLVFLNELTGHMESEKPYLEGDLVLPQLAQQLGISANYLSQIINEQLQVNFYDFVNGYRVEEAKRLMRNAGQQSTKILNIALDSGFNSKSAFYTAFKKATSMTPTQYRNTLKHPVL